MEMVIRDIRFSLELLLNRPLDEIVSLAQLAERRGFDTIWLPDKFLNRNVYTALTAIALSTHSIKLGPGTTNPYVVHPAWTASAAYTLNEVSRGRAVLGISPGDRATLDYIGIKRKKSLGAMYEAVDIISALLGGGAINYMGEVFRLKNAKMRYPPLQESIPIYMGAQGRSMLRIAGSIADGVLLNASHPRDVELAVELIDEGARDSGRKLSDLDIIAWTCFSVGYDSTEAREKAKNVVAFIVAGAPDSILESHGISKERGERIRKAIAMQDLKSSRRLVDEQMIEAFSVSGAPEECERKVEKIARAGAGHIAVGSPVGPRLKEGLEIISEKIIPIFGDGERVTYREGI